MTVALRSRTPKGYDPNQIAQILGQIETALNNPITFGTWTPTLTCATPGDLSVTYSTRFGSYYRIGRLVVLHYSITTSAFTHTTSSGNLQITGIPFTSDTITNNGSESSVRWSGITKANYTHLNMALAVNSTTAIFQLSGSGQSLYTVAITDLPTAGTVNLAGTHTYLASS